MLLSESLTWVHSPKDPRLHFGKGFVWKPLTRLSQSLQYYKRITANKVTLLIWFQTFNFLWLLPNKSPLLCSNSKRLYYKIAIQETLFSAATRVAVAYSHFRAGPSMARHGLSQCSKTGNGKAKQHGLVWLGAAKSSSGKTARVVNTDRGEARPM